MSEQIDSQDLSSGGQEQLQKNENVKKAKKNNSQNKNKILLNISDCQYPVVSRVAKSLGWKLQSNAQALDWDVFWTDNAVPAQVLSKMEPHQKINHFPGMFNLARKNLMGRSLMKMRKKFSQDYSFFPMTWMLPVEYHQLKAYFQTKQKGKARTFIVKPQALSQGKGIFLTRKLQQIDQNAHCVVQRYLHKPYLIEGLKFDMRVYVLVASVDPLRLYIYHEGLTRFATQKYEPPTKQNMQDVCMHLTNYAINKDNPKFVFNNSSSDMTKGHKRSLTWLFQYLQKNQPNSTKLKQRIEDMIVKTMISGLPAISNTYKSCQPQNYASNMCFELLGFDVMLTDKCQPVLLQINHTPSFTTDTPLDNLIKTNYIKDSLTLMNINQKTKESIIRQRKQACQQRVITGKKVKLTNQEKQVQRKKAHQQRQKYQSKHLGGFKKIFPIDDQQKMSQYEQFLNFSTQNFLIATGTKRASTISKKSQKIEAAFGTCFAKKPKQNAKPLISLKNKVNVAQANKNIVPFSKKYDTKKNIQQTTERSSQKLTHSQNLISPKENSQNYPFTSKIKKDLSLSSEQYFQNTKNSNQPSPMASEQLTGHPKKFFQQYEQNCIPISNIRMPHTKSDPPQNPFSHLLFKRSSTSDKQKVDIIQQMQQQSSRVQLFDDKINCGSSFQKSNKYQQKSKLNYSCKQSYSRQKDLSQKGMNNVQIFFDSDVYPSNYVLKKSTPQQNYSSGQNYLKNNEQIKFGIFGINQITSDGDRKKNRIPSNTISNTKTVSNIGSFESRSKQRHLSNRQKIPILLNTLLISSSDSNPAVSANNLRKILTNNK